MSVVEMLMYIPEEPLSVWEMEIESMLEREKRMNWMERVMMKRSYLRTSYLRRTN